MAPSVQFVGVRETDSAWLELMQPKGLNEEKDGTMLTYQGKTETGTTTLNDIPNGTVFEGTITSTQGHGDYTGIWLKSSNNGELSAVGLTMPARNPNYPAGTPVSFVRCVPVKDYRPLKNPRIVED